MVGREKIVYVGACLVLLSGIGYSASLLLKARAEYLARIEGRGVRENAALFAARIIRCSEGRPLPDSAPQRSSEGVAPDAHRCAGVDDVSDSYVRLGWKKTSETSGEVTAESTSSEQGGKAVLRVECGSESCNASEVSYRSPTGREERK